MSNLLSPLSALNSSLPSSQLTMPFDFPIASLAARLDALLFVLKSCKGSVCTSPWKELHPDGDVSTLADALDKKYDYFYEVEQTRVKFQKCEHGYIPESEGPMWEREGKAFTGRMGELPWDVWT